MAGFFEIQTRHDCQINRTPKVDKIGIGLVLDFHRTFLFGFFFVRTIFRATLIFIILFVASFTQDFSLEFSVCFFILLPFGVKFENIQRVLNLNVFVGYVDVMGNLILFFNKVEFLPNRRIVLVAIFPDLKEYFNHILHSLVNVSLVKDTSKLVEDCKRNRLTHFFQMLSHLSRQPDSNLDRIVRRLVQKNQEYLCGYGFMSHLLITEVGDECARRKADSLVVSLESLSELNDQPG